MQFIPPPRASRLADIIAQFATQPNPIAQGIMSAGQSLGQGIAARGDINRQDAEIERRRIAAEGAAKQGNILELLGKGGTFTDPEGNPMDLSAMLPSLGLPKGSSYTPGDKGAIKITPEIIANYPQIQKMGYQPGDSVPASVFNAQTSTKSGKNISLNDEMLKNFPNLKKLGYEAGHEIPESVFNAQTKSGKGGKGGSDEGKIIPANVLLGLNEGKAVAALLPDVELAIKNNSDMFGPVAGRMKSANPYNTQAQTVDARMRTASQAFGRFLEGGVLRKEDEEKYRKMFPQLSDTPEVAKNKLAIVRRQLAQKYESDRTALGASGYDAAGIEALSIPASLFDKKDTKTPAPVGSFTPEMEARLVELENKKSAGTLK